jgi:hypothetical protein
VVTNKELVTQILFGVCLFGLGAGAIVVIGMVLGPLLGVH